AKAGQTLACFAHDVLIEFSPYCRYIEKKVSEVLPRNFYIHQRKNFDQLNSFCLEFMRGDQVCVESDYEAFDASQDCNMLAFEVNLMRYLSLPEHIVDKYIFLKTNLRSKLGDFATMRFTGEFCTFLFNTLSNMVFTFLRYKVRGDEPICFAGDDMCAFRNLEKRHEMEFVLDKLSLTAKVNRTEHPTFCGWFMTKFGIVKHPCLILDRLGIAIEKNKLDLVLDSYCLEFTYAYQLGEKLFEVLNEKLLESQQILQRFFLLNRKRLKGESRLVF
ncbi:replicase domain, partial [Phlomis mottle virus]